MTLKAASRLMLAMDAELSCTLVDPSVSARPRAAVLGPTRVTLILAAVAAFFLLGAESVVAAPASNLRFLARPEVVARLDGPAVALLWRADCGPCLLELKELAALRAAAAPIKVYTVALDAPPVAKQRLETLGVDQGLPALQGRSSRGRHRQLDQLLRPERHRSVDGPVLRRHRYNDPAIYDQLSPIRSIKNAKTPTFIYVGERDVETPAAQSMEFWHGLKAMGVETSLVIYQDEGHGIRQPKNRTDLTNRIVGWFNTHLAP